MNRRATLQPHLLVMAVWWGMRSTRVRLTREMPID